ncbi:MAG TPA: COX15/CtaA family protein, partial [Burkholderiales bacterium]|nr:COX15/CtaA family protein [Burkholderiales bacterium]
MALIFRRLVFFTACFAFVVIVVGAYVRLEDAGLGCPDWPGCYGQLVGVPVEAHEIARAEEAFSKPVDVGRARKEMFHRYIAG